LRSWYSDSLRAGRTGDRIPVRARYKGYRVSFPEVKHSPPCSSKVKERIELSLYFTLWVFMACSRVNLSFCTFFGKRYSSGLFFFKYSLISITKRNCYTTELSPELPLSGRFESGDSPTFSAQLAISIKQCNCTAALQAEN
jgi:hypothetical protein